MMTPRTWGGVLGKSLVVLLVTHAVNVLASRTTDVVDYTVADALATTVLGYPVFVALMATLKHTGRLRRELSVLASTDTLTDLPNRRTFLARMAEAAEQGKAGALLMLDADHFKRVNDDWGHSVGDASLRAIGDHLRRAVRADDLLGRLGGEEFAIFLPEATLAEVVAIGERLCKPVPVPTAGAATVLSLTLSIGVALGDGHLPLARLMNRADQALYAAKAHGRARMVVWSEDCEATGVAAGPSPARIAAIGA